ncbi:MAG: hypothetical protein WCK81_15055 [Betaproteobacteria bacterium]
MLRIQPAMVSTTVAVGALAAELAMCLCETLQVGCICSDLHVLVGRAEKAVGSSTFAFSENALVTPASTAAHTLKGCVLCVLAKLGCNPAQCALLCGLVLVCWRLSAPQTGNIRVEFCRLTTAKLPADGLLPANVLTFADSANSPGFAELVEAMDFATVRQARRPLRT